MSILVTGSVAVDHIMVFRGRFKDVILPDRLHVLNVAFHVPELRKTFGGCAANVAFNLRLLGEAPLLLGTVGNDFDAYAAWLDRHGIRRDWIRVLEDEVTAGAYITTDLDDNQIVGFHAGAMDRAHEAPVADVGEHYEIGIVSPNGKRAMIEHARALKERGVRTVIDPGQGLPLFERDELIELIEGADTYVVNDYEWSLTRETTGLDEEAIAKRVGSLVVTLGEQGSRLRRGDERLEIRAVPSPEVVDPTGCGDAWRAGYLAGRRKGLPLETCARMGSLMGSLAVRRPGTQCLDLDPPGFRSLYEREFGSAP
jgi:adenosine kinase